MLQVKLYIKSPYRFGDFCQHEIFSGTQYLLLHLSTVMYRRLSHCTLDCVQVCNCSSGQICLGVCVQI